MSTLSREQIPVSPSPQPSPTGRGRKPVTDLTTTPDSSLSLEGEGQGEGESKRYGIALTPALTHREREKTGDKLNDDARLFPLP